MSTNVNFPFQFDGRGRTQDPVQEYVRQMVEQVLFTSPGERVNLPDFGMEPPRVMMLTQRMPCSASISWAADRSPWPRS